jgi:hypothetical protein
MALTPDFLTTEYTEYCNEQQDVEHSGFGVASKSIFRQDLQDYQD